MHSRINQSIATDCRTFWPRRPSSTAYQTVCTQLTKAYMILLCICSSRSIFAIFYLVLYIASFIQCIAQLLLSCSLHYSFQIQFVTVCADQISRLRCVNSVICQTQEIPSLLIATQRQQTYCVQSGVIFCTQTYRIERSTGYYMSSLLYCMFTALNLAPHAIHAVHAIYIPLLCVQ